MSFKQIIILFIIGAGLWACSSVRSIYVQTDKLPVTTYTEPNDSIQDFLTPYKEELSEEMDKVIGYATGEFVRYRPEGPLGNFVVDATLDYLVRYKKIPGDQYICLMNHGGLRAPISKGNITVGDIYKLMPFDNTVVIAKLPMHALDSICDYIKSSGGEPIAGFTVKNGPCSLNYKKNEDTLYVVTSDYLYSGGDHMNFFKLSYSHENTGVFLRDMLIDYVEEMDTIRPITEGRISFER